MSHPPRLPALPRDVAVRHDLRPGDLGAIVKFHGEVYAREYGWDATFEAYVAEPLARFVLAPSPRQRIWIAERGGELIGCIAIVPAAEDEAQLRWFLVAPAARGAGLGRRLLAEAVAFCREAGYRSVHLWTVSALAAAARLYREAGFVRTAANPVRQWGAEVVEERYDLDLAAGPAGEER